MPLVVHATTQHHTAHGRGRLYQKQYITDVLSYLAALGPVIPKINVPADDTFIELATACHQLVTGGAALLQREKHLYKSTFVNKNHDTMLLAAMYVRLATACVFNHTCVSPIHTAHVAMLGDSTMKRLANALVQSLGRV